LPEDPDCAPDDGDLDFSQVMSSPHVVDQAIATIPGNSNLGLPVRYLQHGKPSDLYWQFLAWLDALEPAGGEQQTASSYSTFWRVWNSKWKEMLDLLGPLSSCCVIVMTCFFECHHFGVSLSSLWICSVTMMLSLWTCCCSSLLKH